MDKFACLVAARGLGVEEGHICRHEEVHTAGDEVEIHVLAVERLAVDVDDDLVFAVDLEVVALKVRDVLFQLTVAPLSLIHI